MACGASLDSSWSTTCPGLLLVAVGCWHLPWDPLLVRIEAFARHTAHSLAPKTTRIGAQNWDCVCSPQNLIIFPALAPMGTWRTYSTAAMLHFGEDGRGGRERRTAAQGAVAR